MIFFYEFLFVVHFLMCVRRWSLAEFYWRQSDSWVQYFYASSHFLNWAEAEAGVKTNPDSNIKTTFIFATFVQKRISVKHLETNCSNCLHKWFSNRPVPQATSGRLHEINSQTGWLAPIVFTLSISLYSPMFTICSVNFEQLGPNRVLEKLDFGAHCTALLKPLEKQRRAQFCRNQGIYVPCRYESSQ